ncbi:KDEL motif-containing protein 1 [Orussus abietinus]|uniref:KDEL motif-containing protein 1 n=1 Tax=Orussus abietinus TaxID=222816 RepID=UPI000625A967|nr:KDEL motif-containing protein 1 [Orussus abietinus]XP_012285009.1 KDEL motif-containing protein 1 [Orussus abietinus]XP_023289555.1 KDEL motif-containing protein 1 [Orussus abietinus]
MKMMFILLIFFALWDPSTCVGEEQVVDLSRTSLWGPGLNPEQIVMRARYIFVRLYDTNGNALSKSPGEESLTAEIHGTGADGGFCRVWVQTLDCIDGVFIVRYRLYHTCFKMKISIKFKGKHVSSSPLTFSGPVYEEECYCPEQSVTEWLKNNKCTQCNHSQIINDLKPFNSVNFEMIREEIIKKYHRPNSVSICHYVVKDNKIYRQCYGQHVGFKLFADAILMSLARKVQLPDIELFVNLGDWPLVQKSGPAYPVFSWCGSDNTIDIVMPTYDITESSIENMGRVMLDMLSVQSNVKTPWDSKIDKVFWRGRDSRRERLDLIDIARKHPDLINASITNFFFFRDEMDKYGPGEKHISLFEFFKYKYQLNIDGSVAAYRFPYLLAGGSLVLKQDSEYYEFFYKQLERNKHYVPVKKDLSDLVEKITWAREHDEEAFAISRAGQSFTRDNLLPEHIFCYHVSLFHEWSKRIRSTVKVLPGMEEVPQPEHSCECHRLEDEAPQGIRDEF